MKQFKIVVCLLFVGLIIITSCNDSSVIGSEIIDKDQVSVKVQELGLRATTVLNSDSLQTYRATNQLDDYICGYMEDPIFGKFESTINTQLRLSRSLTLQDSLDMKNIGAGSTLDEVFLIVELSDTFYGRIGDDQLVEVYLLNEAMDNNEIYYSTDEFSVGDLLGSKMFTPANPDTTISYLGGTDGTEEIRPDQMEIPLNVNHPIFKDILFAGETSLQYFADDAALLEVFNGLQIRVSNSTPNEGLTIFDPVPASVSTPTVTGLYVKYTSFTADSRLYTFNINENAAKMVNFKPDYSGSIVEPFIGEDNYALGDSLFFVQGMSGINAKLEIQDASTLQNAIINKAELEFTLAFLPEDEPILFDDPISQLLIAIKNADGELERLSDVDQAIIGGNIAIFGGTPVDASDDPNNPVFKYKMNVTSYLQGLVDGEYENAEIFIYPAITTERPQRSVLFGPGHSEHPAKLYVTYTENQ